MTGIGAPPLQNSLNNLNNSINSIHNNLQNSINELQTFTDNLNTTMINSYGSTINTNYIRYNNGLQIVWGIATYPQLESRATGGTTTIFPVPFNNTNYGINLTMCVDAGNSWHTGIFQIVKSVDSFNVFTRNGDSYALSSQNGRYDYVAIGYWK